VDLDFFKEIIKLAAHYGTMVVHDFAYADLCFDGLHGSQYSSGGWREGSGR